jgi:hypothetical protein
MGRRVWRLPVRFSFAANKPGKSRKPSAPAPLFERQSRLGDQHALNRRSSIRYARLPSFHYPVPPSVTIIGAFLCPTGARSHRRRLVPRAFRPHSQIFDCGLEDLPERAGISPPNAAWYPLSLRTDSVNRGISISFLMLARVVLAVSSRIFLLFVIPKY